MIWIVCAAGLFLTAMFLLRLTHMSWFWSATGAVVAAGLYSALYFLVTWLLEILIEGFLWG